MAKWGEGDPRWIVEQRADATNVNNWHWTEKNASRWSKDKLKSLLEGLTLEDDEHKCVIQELSKCEGEAVANNRKGKLIFFYEWDLKADWTGSVRYSEHTHKGTIEIPNLSEENEPEELDINVSASTDKDEAYQLKEFLRVKAAHLIREKLGHYITDLKEEYSKGMILPSAKESASTCDKPQTANNTIKEKLTQPVLDGCSKTGLKIHCKKITDRQEFKCRAVDLYRALTEKEMVKAFTRGEAMVEAERGGRFSLFGDNIRGEFTALEPFTAIEMQWRFKSWPDEHYSHVKIKLEEKEDMTELSLTQTGVPDSDINRTQEGWRRYYWESIKQTFGFGASLF